MIKKEVLEKLKTVLSKEIEAANVEEAIKIATEILKMPPEEITVKVLSEGKPGLFGLKGTHPARVKVTPKFDKVESVIKFYFLTILEFVKEKILFNEVVLKQKIVYINTVFQDEETLKYVKKKEIFNAILLLVEVFVKQLLPEYKINLTFSSVSSPKNSPFS